MTRKRPAAGNEDPSLLVNGRGPFIKRGSGRTTGTQGPHPHIHTRTETLDKELCEVSGELPRRVEPDLLIDVDVAVSH